jgi:Helix-turn-helix domain
MSGLVQGLVWRARLGEPTLVYKAILCRLADEADDEGHDVYPAIATVAGDCSCSLSTVKRVLKWLRDEDWIRVSADEKGGRGHATKYWINVPALKDYQKPSRGVKAAPIARAAEPKGCHTDTLYETQRVSPETQRVSKKAQRVSPDEPLPFTRSKTLSAQHASEASRRASQSAGRSLAVSHESSTPKSGGDRSKRSGMGARGTAPPAMTGKALAVELDVVVDPVALNLWGGLVCAIVKRREIDAARAWLCRRNVVEVSGDGLIIAANRLAFDRINQTFGALLAEQGWRVAMSGAGG